MLKLISKVLLHNNLQILPSQCILASLILGCTSANQARLFAFGLH